MVQVVTVGDGCLAGVSLHFSSRNPLDWDGIFHPGGEILPQAAVPIRGTIRGNLPGTPVAKRRDSFTTTYCPVLDHFSWIAIQC